MNSPTQAPPSGETLSATNAAKLLGVSRRHFYNLKDAYDLRPTPMGTKARPLYRREDVLAMINRISNKEAYRLAAEAVDCSGRPNRDPAARVWCRGYLAYVDGH